MSEANDYLNEILAPKAGPPLTELQETLLRRTEARLVRQKWIHRSSRMGMIAAVFLLGGLAGWLVRPSAGLEHGVVPQPEIVFVPVPVAPSPSGESGSSSPQAMAQGLSGSETELRAEQTDDPKAAAQLYKLAGDTFFRDQDYTNATRCYRLFLVRAGDTALSLNPDDTWLLTSLKNAAFQEKSYAQKTDS